MKKELPQHSIPFIQFPIGCDPEFFFSQNGEIIGSEKVIPKEGNKINEGKIVIDGVQAELNPAPSQCRAILASNIKKCFIELQKTIENRKQDKIEIDFSQTITVKKEELKSLSPQYQVLGCYPSKNAYNKKNQISVKNGSKYYYRSAGGHIHLGKTTNANYLSLNKVFKNEKTLIPLLDTILGNTCVLIDRSPGNIQRRKVYGRAGEYRTPEHGIEYRTLSNFWLQSYPLMSFVTGLARQAVLILAHSTKEHDYAKEILKQVKRTDIKKAINNNDFDLAMKNFEKIENILTQITPLDTIHFPLRQDNIDDFKHFIKKGTNYWFKENPIDHWAKVYSDNQTTRGWENFLIDIVKPDKSLTNQAI